LNLIEEVLGTYYKCTVSAITQKLNVSGHMLIWEFFLFLLYGARAQNLFSSLVTPRICGIPRQTGKFYNN
jgi:hypothetical protein